MPLTATEPTLLSMIAEVALVDASVRVEDWPDVIGLGLAESVQVGAGVVAAIVVAVTMLEFALVPFSL